MPTVAAAELAATTTSTTSQTGSRIRSRRRASRQAGPGADAGSLVTARAPVVPQEQLLEGRRLRSPGCRSRGSLSRPSRPPSAAVSTSKTKRCPDTSASCTPGRSREVGRRGDGELGLDVGAGQVPQLGQRPRLDRAAVPDDGDPVAQRLDLGEDVAGQQHGAAARAARPRCSRGTPPPSTGPGPRSARPGPAARRRRRARRPGRPSAGCPWSRCATFLVGSSSKRSSRSARRRGSSPPRSRPSRSITSPPVRFGHRLTSPGT